jgi:enoyl-CoA hydratase
VTNERVRHMEDRGVHRVVMADGANALDVSLIASLRDCLADLRAGGGAPLLLASSHPRVFCPGWDLKVLDGADRDRVGQVLSSFNALILELFSYPGPTAAAITGHAVAGGCLLAMACDLRVMATGRPRLGFAELNLGLPIPASSLRMLQARIDMRALDQTVRAGDGCSAERARELAMVHHAVSADKVVITADRELRKLGSKPGGAYRVTKEFLFRDSWRSMAADPADDEVFLDCWFDAAAQQRIAEVARSLGR